jgi:hypothetical protein
MLCDIVVSLGKRPVLWADIALKYPEYINLLPKQTIFVDWNYGWAMDRFGAHEALVKSGYEIWGSPSIRSSPDNYFLTRWQYHFNNIRDFIPVCRNLGYKGIVMTSWSTSGVYSPAYESEDDLVDLYALRHVYPLTGFDILISAHIKALYSDQPLNTDQFIKDYCRSTFGFDEIQTGQFKRALFTAPYTITDGKVNAPGNMGLGELLDSARWASNTFHALQPKKNIRMFSHHQLMADIRVYYLSFMEIEKEVNGDDFIRDKIPGYLTRLKALMDQESELDKRFRVLNQDVLYTAAIDEENNLRNQKIHNLYNRLSGIK